MPGPRAMDAGLNASAAREAHADGTLVEICCGQHWSTHVNLEWKHMETMINHEAAWVLFYLHIGLEVWQEAHRIPQVSDWQLDSPPRHLASFTR